MPKARQPDRTGKISKKEFNIHLAEWQCQTVECTNCGSKNTTAISELTRECADCEALIYLDNLPPTDEDDQLENGFNMYLDGDF